MELCVKAKNGNGAEDQEITIKLPMDTLKSLQENMNRDSRAGLSSYTRNLSPMRPNQSMFEKSGSFSFLKSDTQPINKSFGKFQARNQEEEGIVSINSEEENQEKRSSQIQGLINNKIFTPKFWDVNPGQEKNQDPVLQYDPMMRTEQFRGKGFNFANPGRMSQMSGDNKMGNQDRGNSMFGDNSAFMSNALGKFNKDIEGLFKNKKGVEINTHLNPDNNQVEIVLTPKNDEQPHMIGSNFNRSQNQFSFNGQEFKKKGNNPSMLNGDQLKLGSLVDEIMKKVTGGPQQRPPRASKSIAPSRRSTTEFSGEEAIESERSVRESDQRSDILREVQEMGSKWIKQPEAKNKVPVLPLTQPFNRAPEHSYQQNRRESVQGASEFIDIRDECNRQSGANGQFKHGHSRSNNSETNEMLTFENRFESKDDEESGFGMDDKDEFKNSKEKTSNQNMYTLAPQEEKRPERKDNIFGMNGPTNNRGLDVKQSNVSGSQAQQRNNFEFKDNRATNASPVSPKYQMTEKISMAFTSIPKPSENPRPAKPETSIPVQAPTPKQQVESSYMKQANIPKQDCIQRSPIAKSQPEAQEYNRQQNALFDITAPTKKDNLSALYNFNDSNITDVSLDTPVMRALSSIQGKINELNLIMGNQMNNSDTSEFNFNDSKILKESNANFVPEMPMKVAETKNSAKNGRLMINLDHGKENINVLKTPTQKDTRGQECNELYGELELSKIKMVKEKTNEKDLSYLKNFLNQPSKQNEHLADEPSFISDIRGSNCSNFTKQYQIDEMKQSNASSHILKDINPMPSNGSSQQSLQQLKLMDQLRHSKELMNLRRKSRGAEIGGGVTKHY